MSFVRRSKEAQNHARLVFPSAFGRFFRDRRRLRAVLRKGVTRGFSYVRFDVVRPDFAGPARLLAVRAFEAGTVLKEFPLHSVLDYIDALKNATRIAW